ncbi:EamA family transporter [Daeguia caeni]|uniref:EamA family transporter n=1 Tax=Daeguia caeni TaxID=439612 RepID=A0ABV9H2D9_9HYPH
MSGGVLLIVLLGAFCHASWNAIVKGSGDKFFSAAGIALFACLFGLLAVPFLKQPAMVSWPYLVASAIIQTIYLSLVVAAYKAGDMSEAYPLMRGTPPLLVALVSGPLIGEVMSWSSWLGIILICSGILAMALDARRRNKGTSSRAAMIALINAMFIATYTLVDGVGVRLSDATGSYIMWTFILNAIPLTFWAMHREADRFVNFMRGHWRTMMIGGAGTLASYGLALWAMTMAPIAIVAAVRETSILFALLISGLILKERIGASRMVAAALIVCGAIVLRLS